MRISDWSSDVCSSDLQLLGQRDPEGIGARLEKWARGGSLGWVFDNEIDALSLEAPFVGFDMTDFLDNPGVRTPLMMYMFHRIDGLLDGRRLVIDIDEFWKALGADAFRAFARSAERRVGIEGVSTCSSRWAAYH